MRHGLVLGLSRRRKTAGGDPYKDVLALEYDLTGIAEPTTIALAIQANSTYFGAGQEASINWDDGSTPTVVSATPGQSGYISHEYANAGTYVVKISGTMKAYRRIDADNLAGQDRLTHVYSFGKLGIESFMYAFRGCTSLISVPKDCPNGVSDMRNMFRDCSGDAFNPDVSNWDVSSVRNMYGMFVRCSGAAFNPDVSSWNVSKVTDMNSMFYQCSGASFNPDVSNWNVSSVKDMGSMFRDCSKAAFRGGRGTAGAGIANWTPDSLTTATSFMNSSKKQENGFLDSILIAWAALIGDQEHPLPGDVTIHFGTNTYTADALVALGALENHGTSGWVISSGGLVQ